MFGSKIFVSGICNIESTLKVNNFPINFSSIEYLFNGISANVSGVAYNVSKALRTLGNEIHIHTLIGDDSPGHAIIHELKEQQIGAEGVYRSLDATPQSIIIYDSSGRRKIYCDLKDVQEASYPTQFTYLFGDAYDLAILTNVNFSRDFFSIFKERNIPIATDCHVLSSLDNEYDKEFLENANIVFLSNEAIKGHEEDFMQQLIKKYNQDIIVIGMSDQGSMLYDRVADKIHRVPAVTVRPIVNTIGAGDALFSSFLHFYIQGEDPIEALQYATFFASYKIGANGGAEGFLTEPELMKIIRYHKR